MHCAVCVVLCCWGIVTQPTSLVNPTQPRAPQIRAVRQKMEELQANHGAAVAGILEQYHALRRQVSHYHTQLGAAMAPAALQQAAAT